MPKLDYCALIPASIAQRIRNEQKWRKVEAAINEQERAKPQPFTGKSFRPSDDYLRELGILPALAPPVCETCNGEGEIDETLGGISTSDPHAECPDCKGSGTVTQMTNEGPDSYHYETDCRTCDGTGAPILYGNVS